MALLIYRAVSDIHTHTHNNEPTVTLYKEVILKTSTKIKWLMQLLFTHIYASRFFHHTERRIFIYFSIHLWPLDSEKHILMFK